MKKFVIAAAVLVTAFAAARRLGPVVGARAMKKCEELFDRMPDAFPPKRMLRGIEEIREQNLEILRALGERDGRTLAAAG